MNFLTLKSGKYFDFIYVIMLYQEPKFGNEFE